MRTFTQKLTNTAFLIVVCVVLGLIFLPLLNVELITAGIFFAGIWMGPRLGLFIGAVSEGLFSLFNPMGVPLPPLLAAQVAVMGLVGWVGGLSRNLLMKNCTSYNTKWPVYMYLVVVGAVLTLCFDLLTNLAFALTAGFKAGQIKAWLIAGSPFAILHVIVNAFAFAILIPMFLSRIKFWREL